MNTNQHIAPDDLTLFALQLLSEAEMASMAVHLKECELCKAQLGEMQGDLVAYALTAELQSPPVQARERLLQQVAKEKKFIPVERAEQELEPVLAPRNARMFQMDAPAERPSRTPVIMAWAGWAVAAGVAVAAGLQYQQTEQVRHALTTETAKLDETSAEAAQAKAVMQTLTDAGAMQVSLHLTPTGATKVDPEGHVAYVREKGSLVFVANHLDPLQQDKTYELWLISSEGKAIPAGLFKPDGRGNATVVMPELPKGVEAKAFGVTVEDDGGAKTPTKPIVLIGMAE
jgi:anti-sigma-K factor RskA